MESLSTEALIIWLIVLLVMSAFFSGSETGMMRVNRYKLKSLINSKSKRRNAARRVKDLLKRPDRLLGLILIGNNFVNILATFLFGILAVRLWGEYGLAIAPFLLTIIVLIFAELAPKTLAALFPESIAYPASALLKPLVKIFYPLVWLINFVTNQLLRIFGVKTTDVEDEKLDPDELRAIVAEASPLIPRRHQKMLLNILNLESSTVEDIMVPRREIVGVNVQNDWDEIISELRTSQHTRLLVYDGDFDNPLGILHARNLVNMITTETLTPERLKEAMSEVYYVPEGTPLHTQLLNFQRKKERIGAVVDEYGDIQGLVTLEDILEEIVGEFTTDLSADVPDILRLSDGSLLADCTVTIRDLNKVLQEDLPLDGPKTLNGLITEYLEFLPGKKLGFRLYGYPMEITEADDNRLITVKIYPAKYRSDEPSEE